MIDIRGFNAEEHEPAGSFEPIPPGDYTAIITDSESKQTKSGNGEYLQFAFQIVEGEHKGRVLWARLNLDNPSETAVKIAKGELSAICRAVDVLTPNDPVELHNIPLVIKVGTKRREDNGETTNVIRGYIASKNAAAYRPNRVPMASAGDRPTPPWMKNS